MKKAILIDGRDNVATVTSDLGEGEIVEVLLPDGSVHSRTDVLDVTSFGHKIAVTDITKGMNVVKYAEVIGVAVKDIQAGEWVHTHNVASSRVPAPGEEPRWSS